MLLNPILQVILKGVCSSKNMLTMNKKQKIFQYCLHAWQQCQTYHVFWTNTGITVNGIIYQVLTLCVTGLPEGAGSLAMSPIAIICFCLNPETEKLFPNKIVTTALKGTSFCFLTPDPPQHAQPCPGPTQRVCSQSLLWAGHRRLEAGVQGERLGSEPWLELSYGHVSRCILSWQFTPKLLPQAALLPNQDSSELCCPKGAFTQSL